MATLLKNPQEINICVKDSLKLLELTLHISDILAVFTPSDEAFKMVPKHVLEYLGKNKTALQELLMYHAAPDMKASGHLL